MLKFCASSESHADCIFWPQKRQIVLVSPLFPPQYVMCNCTTDILVNKYWWYNLNMTAIRETFQVSEFVTFRHIHKDIFHINWPGNKHFPNRSKEGILKWPQVKLCHWVLQVEWRVHQEVDLQCWKLGAWCRKGWGGHNQHQVPKRASCHTLTSSR